ncbi:MAG: OmpA family protein [Elusimicrobiota bacterium]
MRGWLSVLLTTALAIPALGMGLDVFDGKAENRRLRDAQQELKDLERRIQKKDIPPIEFELDKAVLRAHSKQTLELLADLMFRYPSFKLFISGHTCDIGSEEYNLWLSQKRAEAVKDYLVYLGVMGEFIKAKGYGEAKPVADNETEEGREKNRRVEFHITTRWWHSVY